MEAFYDALAPHVALIIVVDPNCKDYRRPNLVGEVFPFFPLCIDDGSFCSMPNRERGTTAVTCEASRAMTNPRDWVKKVEMTLCTFFHVTFFTL